MWRFPWIWMAWKKAEYYKSCASCMTSQLKRGIITSLHTKKSQVFSSFCSVCVPVSLFSQKGFDFLGGLLLPKHPNKTEFRKWDLLYVKVNGGFSLSHWLTWSFRMNKAQKNFGGYSLNAWLSNTHFVEAVLGNLTPNITRQLQHLPDSK